MKDLACIDCLPFTHHAVLLTEFRSQSWLCSSTVEKKYTVRSNHFQSGGLKLWYMQWSFSKDALASPGQVPFFNVNFLSVKTCGKSCCSWVTCLLFPSPIPIPRSAFFTENLMTFQARSILLLGFGFGFPRIFSALELDLSRAQQGEFWK